MTRKDKKLLAAAPALLEAVKLLQRAIAEFPLPDRHNPRKYFSLMLADSAANKAIFQVEDSNA